jgi:ankyrin repeat protein
MKADIDIPGEFEQTPLHLAVIKDNVELIKLFVSNGADITLVDEKNLTALDYAKDENNIDIIEFLEKEMKKISRKEIN